MTPFDWFTDAPSLRDDTHVRLSLEDYDRLLQGSDRVAQMRIRTLEAQVRMLEANLAAERERGAMARTGR